MYRKKSCLTVVFPNMTNVAVLIVTSHRYPLPIIHGLVKTRSVLVHSQEHMLFQGSPSL